MVRFLVLEHRLWHNGGCDLLVWEPTSWPFFANPNLPTNPGAESPDDSIGDHAVDIDELIAIFGAGAKYWNTQTDPTFVAALSRARLGGRLSQRRGEAG